MNCPKCSSDKKVKSGFTKGRQRYKCKGRGCNFTVEMKSAKQTELKQLKNNCFWRKTTVSICI